MIRPVQHVRAVSGIFAYFATLILILAVSCGCAHTSAPPRVQAQGHFTEPEMRSAVDSVFGPGTYRKHATGANVRRYTTYRVDDYAEVSQHVRENTEPWSMGWLCVQFAQEMRLEMYRAGVRSGSTDYPAAIGWFIVRQAYTWGGVPGGEGGEGRHALNVFVAGPRGQMQVWVLEPQTGAMAQVGTQGPDGWTVHPDAYPNLPYVEQGGVYLEL